jgi:hypothetical protein
MTERDLPFEMRSREEDPGGHQRRFAQLETLFDRGELTRRNEDGTTTPVVSYQRHVDPLDKADLSTLAEFRLRAAALGYREAFSPIILPTAATLEPGDREAVTNSSNSHRPLSVVQLGYEKPGPTKPPQEGRK